MIDVNLGKAQLVFLAVLQRMNSGEITLEQFERFSALSQAQLSALPTNVATPCSARASFFDPAEAELTGGNPSN